MLSCQMCNQLGLHFIFICYISLNLEVTQSLFFITLTFLKSMGTVFYKMPLGLDLSGFMNRFRLCILGRNTSEVMSYPSQSIVSGGAWQLLNTLLGVSRRLFFQPTYIECHIVNVFVSSQIEFSMLIGHLHYFVNTVTE